MGVRTSRGRVEQSWVNHILCTPAWYLGEIRFKFPLVVEALRGYLLPFSPQPSFLKPSQSPQPWASLLLLLSQTADARGRALLCVFCFHLPSHTEGRSFSPLTRELYPVLIRALQAVPKELSSPSPQPLALQRAASLLTVLTQLTLAAGSTTPEPRR